MAQMMIKSPSGFTVGAKHLGTNVASNYYQTADAPGGGRTDFNGLIHATGSGDAYQAMTLCFSVYPLELPESSNWYIFDSDGEQFRVGNWDSDGGIWTACRTFAGIVKSANTTGDGAGDYAGMEINAWNSIMISFFINGPWRLLKMRSNGVDVYDALWGTGNDPNNPMSWSGHSWVGWGDGAVGMECYISNVWCAETFLPPLSYYSSFYDENNKPKDIGVDGSAVTGSAPDTYARDGDFTNNTGFGDSWGEIGTVPDAPISPTD